MCLQLTPMLLLQLMINPNQTLVTHQAVLPFRITSMINQLKT